MAKIFLACGHGGKDAGAVSKFSVERDLAIKVANDAERYLKNQKLGKRYVRVPDSLALEGEVAWINKNLASTSHDVAINLHMNSNVGTAGTGTETWYGHKGLAVEVNSEVVAVLKLPNRGVKRNDLFWFNRGVKCASCILEMGFNNNSRDVAVIKKNGGLALAKAIVRASGGKWRNPVVVKPKPVAKPVVKVPTVVTDLIKAKNVPVLAKILETLKNFFAKK